MESTIPGKTRCTYKEASSPQALTDEINKFLDVFVVLDIKYIQNYQMYGAYIIYLDGDTLDVNAKVEYATKPQEYEIEDPNTFGLS